MKYLVDTHLILWSEYESEKLPEPARAALEEPSNELFFSVIAIWECILNRSMYQEYHSLDPVELRNALLEAGWRELPVSGNHVLAAHKLPKDIVDLNGKPHRDPYDRMLVAQSVSEARLVLLTNDEVLARYGSNVRYV